VKIEIEKDPISLEDILSPAEAISTKIKSDAMNDARGLYFRKPSTETMEDEQGSDFKQNSSPTPLTTAPKRSSTNKKQRHEHVPKLRNLHPKDPSKVPHRYPKQGNRTVKSEQTLTMYAKKHDLLEKEGWKRFRRIANRDQYLQRLVKQAKLRSFRVSPKYKYGYSIPRNYKEAIEFDERNGNTKWQDAMYWNMDNW
jgi:hypothetical protein